MKIILTAGLIAFVIFDCVFTYCACVISGREAEAERRRK